MAKHPEMSSCWELLLPVKSEEKETLWRNLIKIGVLEEGLPSGAEAVEGRGHRQEPGMESGRNKS